MLIDFYDPPPTLLAQGSKEGVDLGGSKLILSMDDSRNLFSQGNIFTEMSWAEFYKEKQEAQKQKKGFIPFIKAQGLGVAAALMGNAALIVTTMIPGYAFGKLAMIASRVPATSAFKTSFSFSSSSPFRT